MTPRSRDAAQGFAGHQHLAFAVLRQAILDAGSPSAPAAARHSARRFLSGDRMYRFWSAVATARRHAAALRHGS